MSNPIVIACLVAVFSWWFFTGVILLLVRYSDSASYRVRGFYAIASLPLFLIGFLSLAFILLMIFGVRRYTDAVSYEFDKTNFNS